LLLVKHDQTVILTVGVGFNHFNFFLIPAKVDLAINGCPLLSCV